VISGGDTVKHYQHFSFLLSFSAVALLSAASSVWGQAATGRAFGTVTDQQHAVVPDAKVTITNEATRVANSTVTKNEGYFEILDLPIGTYALTVERLGFPKYVTTSNKLLINESLNFEVTLKVGAPTQIVTVEAQASQVRGPTILLAAVPIP
jgi:Carboxypeptidase regulatory-like domain